MKLAEALLVRADTQKECSNLLSRVQNNALVQEGDEPGEDPKPILQKYNEKFAQLTKLVPQINRTNAETAFSSTESLADAIVRRDMLAKRLSAYRNVIEALQIRPSRYSATEIRFVRCLDPSSLQKEIDAMSKEYRELDMEIQEKNWETELTE